MALLVFWTRCHSDATLSEGELHEGLHEAAGASWELRVYLGHDPLTGKKRYATRDHADGARRQREAQTALAEMVTGAERGLTARTMAAVGELLEAWFEFAAPDFSPKTVKETRRYIDCLDAYAPKHRVG